MAQSRPAHRCRHCSRQFARAEHLTRHERTHTKEKPYLCSLCSDSFSRPDLLRRHEAKSHNQRRPDIPRSARRTTASKNSSSPSDRQTTDATPAACSPIANLEVQGLPDAIMSLPDDQTNSIEQAVYSGGWLHDSMSHLPPEQEFGQGMFTLDTTSWMDMCQTSHGASLPTFDLLPTSTSANLFENIPPSAYEMSVANTDRRSILSRPASPHDDHLSSPGNTPGQSISSNTLTLSELHRGSIQEKISDNSSYRLPPRTVMATYVNVYFNNFNRHQPILHEPTWSANDAPPPLLLAVCANGAIYSLESSDAFKLYGLAVALLPTSQDHELWAIQTLMLLTAFAAWAGNLEELPNATGLHSRLYLAIRRMWGCQANIDDPQATTSWEAWIELESRRRATCCAFTVLNLMHIALDIPSPVTMKAKYGLPCQERLWTASSEHSWLEANKTETPRELQTAPAILEALFDESRPVPVKIGMFGCHVLISALLQQVLFFQRSHPHYSSRSESSIQARQRYVTALRRWQLMWESEPESSLSLNHPKGPILFNCTAMLRIAYIRLVADYSPLRSSFTFDSHERRAQGIVFPLPQLARDLDAERAALHACLALQIPAKLGLRVVSRTSFWGWSVQHGLSYFECALFLSQWVEMIEAAEMLTESEARMKAMVEQVVHTSRPRSNGDDSPQSLAASLLLLWAELLDTGQTTVWKIMPRMAEVLRVQARAMAARA